MARAVRAALLIAATVALGSSSLASSSGTAGELPPFGQFDSLRARENAKCGSCHETVYANWLAGPHARAYRQLEVYRAAIEAHPERATIEPYVAHVGQEFEGRCTWCHATRNLFEDYYEGVEEQGPGAAATQAQWEDYFVSALGFEHGFPRGRDEVAGLETGVDCLTCHKRGDRVVTRAGYVRDPAAPRAEGQCDPVPSPLFSSNYGCRGCHVDNVVAQQHVLDKAEAGRGPAKLTTDCVACHQETDAQGHGTHYFYWAHDIPTGRRDRLLGGMFDSLKVDVEEAEAGERKLTVSWRNEVHNHLTSLCQEYIVALEVRGQDGSPVAATFETRLNRKEQFDEIELAGIFGGETPGRAGHDFDPNHEVGLREAFVLPADAPPGGLIAIEARHKHQYWLPDDMSTLVFKRQVPWGDAVGQIEPVAVVPPFDPADPEGSWQAMHAARDAAKSAQESAKAAQLEVVRAPVPVPETAPAGVPAAAGDRTGTPGCSCQAHSGPVGGSGAALWLLIAATLVWLRRRR